MALDKLQENIIDALPSVEEKDLENVAYFVQAKIDEALMAAADAAARRLNLIYNDNFTRTITENDTTSYYVEHYAAAKAVRAVIEAETSSAGEDKVNP